MPWELNPLQRSTIDGFVNVNQKSFRRTGVPDWYLDFGLVWKLDFHRAFLGIKNKEWVGALRGFLFSTLGPSTLQERPSQDSS